MVVCEDTGENEPHGTESLAWNLGIGRRMPDGRVAGTATFHEQSLTSSSYHFRSWKFQTFSTSVHQRGSRFSDRWQIKTPDRLFDFVSIDSNRGHESYEIRIYRAKDVVFGSGGGDEPGREHSTNYYLIESGRVPYVKYLVANPGLHEGLPAIRITTVRGAASIERLFWCSYNGSENIFDVTWHTLEGNGARHIVKTQTYNAHVGNHAQIKVYGQGDILNSWTESEGQTFPSLPQALAKPRRTLDIAWMATDNGSQKRQTQYDYYLSNRKNDGGVEPGWGELKSATRSDGSWERHSYGIAHPSYPTRILRTPGPSKTYRPWNGTPASPNEATDTNCHVTHTIYSVDGGSAVSNEPVRVEEWIRGIKVSEAFTLWTLGKQGGESIRTASVLTTRRVLDSDGFDDDGRDDDGLPDNPSQDANHDGRDDDGLDGDGMDDDGYADNPTNLMATRTTYDEEDASPFLRGKPLLTVETTGATKAYTYTRGDWDAARSLFIPLVSYPDPDLSPDDIATDGRAIKTIVIQSGGCEDANDGLSRVTRTITVRDKNHDEVERIEEVQLLNQTWMPMHSTRNTFDLDGNLLTSMVNGTFILIQAWIDGRLVSKTELDGTYTSYEYDTLGRVGQERRHGVPATAQHDAQPDIFTNYIYDAADRLLKTTRTAGTLTTTSSTTYDLAGRVLTTTDESGSITQYSYEAMPTGGTETTITRPGGATEITRRTSDGLVTSIQGTAVPPHTYQYEMTHPGILITKEATGGEAMRWIKRYTNDRGDLIKEIKRNTLGNELATHFFYNDQGLLARTERPGLASELRYYDGTGQLVRSGLDMNNDRRLTPESNDRYRMFTRGYFVTSTANSSPVLWHKQSTLEYTQPTTGPNSTDGDALSTTQQTRIGSPFLSESTTTYPGGIQSTAITTIDPENRLIIASSSSSRATNVATSITINGLLVSQSSASVPEPVRFKYDALGRRTKVIDPRTSLSSTTSYDAASRVATTSDALGHITTYSYYPVASATPGRLATVTPPAEAGSSRATHYAYDSRGNTTHQWGPGTYPVRYDFDSNTGEMVKMHTYRNDSTSSTSVADPSQPQLPACFAGSGDITQWLYNPFSGQLAEKRIASVLAAGYSYDLGTGLLHRRSWARQQGTPAQAISATYAYSAAGDLLGIDYSDATADVAYTRDRMGRIKTITDAAGTHSFSYDPATGQMLGESHSAGALDGLAVSAQHDSQGRRASLVASQGSSPLASTFYTYASSTSRLQSIYVDGTSATYGYAPASDLIHTLSYTGPAAAPIVGERLWDNASRLTTVAYRSGSALTTAHSYSLDAAGRRTLDTLATGDHWAYGYNDRGEVTSGTRTDPTGNAKPGSTWAYDYDSIGNRTTSDEHSVTDEALLRTSYTTDAKNQYYARTIPQPARKAVRGTAHPQASVTVKTFAPGQTTPEQTLTAQRQGSEFTAEPTVPNAATNTHND